MASPQDFIKNIGDELADFVAWAKEKLADSDVRREIARDLGLNPGEAVPDADLPQDRLDSVERYRSQADPDREAFFILLSDVRAVYEALRAFIRACGVSDLALINELVYRMFESLALNYFRLRHPKFYFVSQLISSLAEDSAAIEEEGFVIERFFTALARVYVFLLSPVGYLYKSLWFGVQNEQEARVVAERTFTHLAAFLVMARSIDPVAPLGTKEIILGWDPLLKSCPEPGDRLTPRADEISERMLSFALVDYERDEQTRRVTKKGLNVSMAVVPQSHGASGFFIGFGGGGEIDTPLGDRWKLRAEFSSPTAASFLIQKELIADKWLLSARDANEARAVLSLVTTPDPETGITFQLPDGEGTRVEIGQLNFSVVFSAQKTEIRAMAERSALVLALKDNDGFIGSLIPDDGIRIPINFGVGYSEEKGFYTEGDVPFLSGKSTRPPAPPDADAAPPEPDRPPTLSAGKAPQLGLERVIPVGKKLGPATIRQLFIGLFPGDDPASPKVEAEVSTSLLLSLGPVLASVDRIGFKCKLGFPKTGGNAGFADIDLGLKLPTGVGLKLDSQVVTGGGFLSLDPERGLYAGEVHLDIQGRLGINARGLLATRLPNGEKGFSLLVIITAQGFKPIPLGLGFMLAGIGGLVAINRTFDEAVLRAGIKEHTLDSVLFPQDPVRNAPQILSTLDKVFPIAKGHHLFGPMVQIVWGTPPLITMNLAVVLELGARLRLLVLGQVLAILPTAENDLIRLQLDAVGIIDFDQGTASLDASLYDSRLLNKFVLTGDMAMRLKWESPRSFALAVGGLHPAFNPPPNFPKLERVAINLAAGDNPRFRCEAYFAITSNTLQFGARAELFASAFDFSIHGEVGFDVLIQFDPFAFQADFRAQVQLKRHSRTLFMVKVEGALSGPRPLHIRGKATFEVLWFDCSVRFDKTLVEGEKPPRPLPVSVLPHLKEALGNPGNWLGALPDGRRQMVTLGTRQGAANEVLLHPLGTLTVKQSVVPLDATINRFGPAPVAGTNIFRITGVSLGGQNLLGQTVKVTDFFAPAQFEEMTDDQKLSSPSFQPMTAGVRFGSDKFSFPREKVDPANPAGESNWLVASQIEYETKVIDKESKVSEPSTRKYTLPPQSLKRQYRFGAAGASDLRRTGQDKYRAAAPGKYKIEGEVWSVISTADLSVQPIEGVEAGRPATYSEAVRELKRHSPSKAAGLKVVRLSELEL